MTLPLGQAAAPIVDQQGRLTSYGLHVLITAVTTQGTITPGNAAIFVNQTTIEDGGAVPSGGMTQLTGDVTAGPGSGSQAATIANNAVTTAKINNGAVTEAKQTLADNTTANVTSAAHGYAPKSPADATKFLNGAATPAYALVKDSDLSTSDITTNNVTIAKHGFTPKLPNDATKYLDGTGAYTVPTGSSGGITQLTGDVTAGPGSGSQAATLANTAVTPGTYGDATNVAQVTVDSKGRITAATNVAISGGGGGGGWVLLDTQVASTSATLDFVGSITSTYNLYIFELEDIVPGTTGTDLYLLASSNGGSSYLGVGNYSTVYFRWSRTGSSTGGNSSDSHVSLCGALSLSNDTTAMGLSGDIRIYNPLATTWKKITGHTTWYYNGTPELLGATNSSAITASAAIDAFQFLPSSGTFSGTIRLYGVEK